MVLQAQLRVNFSQGVRQNCRAMFFEVIIEQEQVGRGLIRPAPV